MQGGATAVNMMTTRQCTRQKNVVTQDARRSSKDVGGIGGQLIITTTILVLLGLTVQVHAAFLYSDSNNPMTSTRRSIPAWTTMPATATGPRCFLIDQKGNWDLGRRSGRMGLGDPLYAAGRNDNEEEDVEIRLEYADWCRRYDISDDDPYEQFRQNYLDLRAMMKNKERPLSLGPQAAYTAQPSKDYSNDWGVGTVAQLKEACKDRNLLVSGAKTMLVERLDHYTLMTTISAKTTKTTTTTTSSSSSSSKKSTATTEEDLPWSTVKELKAECRSRGLPVSGTKAVLIQRLLQAQDDKDIAISSSDVDDEIATDSGNDGMVAKQQQQQKKKKQKEASTVLPSPEETKVAVTAASPAEPEQEMPKDDTIRDGNEDEEATAVIAASPEPEQEMPKDDTIREENEIEEAAAAALAALAAATGNDDIVVDPDSSQESGTSFQEYKKKVVASQKQTEQGPSEKVAATTASKDPAATENGSSSSLLWDVLSMAGNLMENAAKEQQLAKREFQQQIDERKVRQAFLVEQQKKEAEAYRKLQEQRAAQARARQEEERKQRRLQQEKELKTRQEQLEAEAIAAALGVASQVLPEVKESQAEASPSPSSEAPKKKDQIEADAITLALGVASQVPPAAKVQQAEASPSPSPEVPEKKDAELQSTEVLVEAELENAPFSEEESAPASASFQQVEAPTLEVEEVPSIPVTATDKGTDTALDVVDKVADVPTESDPQQERQPQEVAKSSSAQSQEEERQQLLKRQRELDLAWQEQRQQEVMARAALIKQQRQQRQQEEQRIEAERKQRQAQQEAERRKLQEQMEAEAIAVAKRERELQEAYAAKIRALEEVATRERELQEASAAKSRALEEEVVPAAASTTETVQGLKLPEEKMDVGEETEIAILEEVSVAPLEKENNAATSAETPGTATTKPFNPFSAFFSPVVKNLVSPSKSTGETEVGKPKAPEDDSSKAAPTNAETNIDAVVSKEESSSRILNPSFSSPKAKRQREEERKQRQANQQAEIKRRQAELEAEAIAAAKKEAKPQAVADEQIVVPGDGADDEAATGPRKETRGATSTMPSGFKNPFSLLFSSKPATDPATVGAKVVEKDEQTKPETSGEQVLKDQVETKSQGIEHSDLSEAVTPATGLDDVKKATAKEAQSTSIETIQRSFNPFSAFFSPPVEQTPGPTAEVEKARGDEESPKPEPPKDPPKL